MKNIFEKMRTLIVLAECRSFTETSQRLYCSQPTVSQHINSLEEDFGCKLLHRKGKNIVLTKQGMILVEYARRIQKLMEDVTLDIQKADNLHHVLSIYVSNYFAKYYLPKILPIYLQDAHQNLYELNGYCYNDLKRCLQEEETSFAIMPLYANDCFWETDFEATILFEEELRLVVPASHRFSGRKILYCRDLQNEIILLPNSYPLQQMIIKSLRDREIKVNYLRMSNFELIMSSIKAGLGIAFLPRSVVDNAADREGVAIVNISALHIVRKNGLIVRKDVLLSEEEQTFIQVVKDYFGKENDSQHCS